MTIEYRIKPSNYSIKKTHLYHYSSQMVSSMPTLYNVDNNTNEGEAVMVPVASTVIPLEDLPVFKVDLFVYFNLGFTYLNLMFCPTSK